MIHSCSQKLSIAAALSLGIVYFNQNANNEYRARICNANEGSSLAQSARNDATTDA